jgi:hypothetical protein
MKIEKLISKALYISDNYVDVYVTGLMIVTSRVINNSVFGIILIRTGYKKDGEKI